MLILVIAGSVCVLVAALGVWFLRHDRAAHMRLALETESPSEQVVAATRDYPPVAQGGYPDSAPVRVDSDRTGHADEKSSQQATPDLLADPNARAQLAAKLAAEAVRKLEASGPAPAGTSDRAWKIVEQWKGLSSAAGGEFADFRCFKGGCAVTSTHPNFAAAESAGEEGMRPERLLEWPGQAFRSGPMQHPSGKVQFVWILYVGDPPASVAP